MKLKSLISKFAILSAIILGARESPTISHLSVVPVDESNRSSDWPETFMGEAYLFSFILTANNIGLADWQNHQYQFRVFDCNQQPNTLAPDNTIYLPGLIEDVEGDDGYVHLPLTQSLLDRRSMQHIRLSQLLVGTEQIGLCIVFEGRNDLGLAFQSNVLSY